MNRLATALAVAATVIAFGGSVMAETAHDFSFSSIDGKPLPLSTFKGKTVLVVNTASFCGYTPQYEGLQSLWEDNKDQDLVVLGVPANNFGAQEPGSNDEIKDFCESKYDVSFPLTEKVSVKGGDIHPFYKWAAETLGDDNAPKWNFHKYLIDADGKLVAAFPSKVKPESDEIKAAIAKAKM